MDIGVVTTLIQDLGFPIAAVIGMAIFALSTSKAAREDNNKAMEMLQQRCLAREERMSEQLGRNENILQEAIKTLTFYETKLTDIDEAVQEIKTLELQRG